MSTSANAQPPTPVQGIRELAEMCRRAGVTELHADDATVAVRLLLEPEALDAGDISLNVVLAVESASTGPYVQLSQWVGIFHRGAFDGAVMPQEGRAVRKGEALGVIVAMGLEHELLCDRDGIIERFLIEDGAPVEYGQPLLEIS